MTRVEQLQAMRGAFTSRLQTDGVEFEQDGPKLWCGPGADPFNIDAACAMMLDAIAPEAALVPQDMNIGGEGDPFLGALGRCLERIHPGTPDDELIQVEIRASEIRRLAALSPDRGKEDGWKDHDGSRHAPTALLGTTALADVGYTNGHIRNGIPPNMVAWKDVKRWRFAR